MTKNNIPRGGLDENTAHISRNLGTAVIALEAVRDNLAKAANERHSTGEAGPPEPLVEAVEALQKVVGSYNSALLRLNVNFFSLFHHEEIDGWIQPPLGPETKPIVLTFSLKNNTDQPTSGTVFAVLTDYWPGINGAEPRFIPLEGTDAEVINLAPGDTKYGALSFDGAPPGLYSLDVNYNIPIEGQHTGQLVYNPETQLLEPGKAYYSRTWSFYPYIASSDSQTDAWMINSLLGITIDHGPPGCLTARGTSRDGRSRYLRTTCASENGRVLSELTYRDSPKDVPIKEGLGYRVRTQAITYSEKGEDGRTILPSYTVTIESGKADWNYDGQFLFPTKCLTLKATPGREGLIEEMRIEGSIKKESYYATVDVYTDEPIPRVYTTRRLLRWRSETPIAGYLSHGVYQPNLGSNNEAFDVVTLFGEEIQHLSYFASVLREFDLLEPIPKGPSGPGLPGGLGTLVQAQYYEEEPTRYRIKPPMGPDPPRWLVIALIVGLAGLLISEIAAAGAVTAALAELAYPTAGLTGAALADAVKLGKEAARSATLLHRVATGIVIASGSAATSVLGLSQKDFGPVQPPPQPRGYESGYPPNMPNMPSMPAMPSLPPPWNPGPADCFASCPLGFTCMYGQCIDARGIPIDE